MAAKLLHSLADDNPDLQKQIGCMNGIFQIFDRHHMGRRVNGHTHKELLPPGNSQFSNASLDPGSKNAYNQDALEKNGHKDANDKRMTTKSSRASLPSSFAPSFSSLDSGKVGHPDLSSLDRITIHATHSREPVLTQPTASPKLKRLSLDLRDVVKDSMHREYRGLPGPNMMKEECVGHLSKHKDSPRPLVLSKSLDGSLGVGMKEKSDLPGDLKESLKLLAKFRDAPWYEKEHARLSYQMKDDSLLSTSRDAPRYSYDGREMNPLCSESRDFSNSNQRIKELPRLSLDSRESSMRVSSYDLNLAHLSKNAKNEDDMFTGKTLYSQELSRPPSVVAKLMGLETSPNNKLSRGSQLGPTKVASLIDHGYSMSSKTSDIRRPARLPSSPRSSRKEPTSPRWKHADMRPISSSKCPIEPAPWKYLEGGRSLHNRVLKQLNSPEIVSNSSPSVYKEIEKRLKDLEFEQSGKDLRALKQILEAMEAKGLLGKEKEEQNSILQPKGENEQACKGSSGGSGLISASESDRKRAGAPMVRRAGSTNACESSIVTMKPGLQSQDNNIVGSGKNSLNRRAAKNQTSKESRRDHAVSTSTNRESSNRTLRVGQSSTKAQQVSRDNNVSSVKSLVSTSPRLQKKVEFDKRSHPPNADSGRSRRLPNRQSTESGGSPGGRRRVKSSIMVQNDEHVPERSSECRNERSTETSQCQIPSTNAVNCSAISEIRTNSSTRPTKGDIAEELCVIAPEHPSPISVLDALEYGEDSPSPVKQISHNLEGIGPKTLEGDCVEGEWESVDNLSANHAVESGFTSEINCTKVRYIDNLVDKLRQLKSDPNEIGIDYIASLCQSPNPDHRYVLEILLASGLLLCDLSSAVSTFPLHQSGQLINPELFLVLEQTKLSSLLHKADFKNDDEATKSKLVHGKLHRKLIFDAVNEIVGGKLASLRPPAQPWLKSCELTKKTLDSQKLLREVCAEIEQLKASERPGFSIVEGDDGVKSILREDVVYRSESWTDFRGDVSGAVLDVERLIFRDLVDEVVVGEGQVSHLHRKPRKQCRRLFIK